MRGGLALLLVALSCPVIASAQTEEEPVERADAEAMAREHFTRGVELSRQERWGEALEYFRRSRALVERPSTTFNIALALLRLGHPTEGRATLEEYLAQSEGLEREEARRAQAPELMELANSSIAELTLEVAPPEAELRIDGVLIEATGAERIVPLDPGTHSLRVTYEGYTAQTLDLSLLEGERASRAIALSARTDPARVRVTANVASAVIRIDDEEVGTGRYSGELEPGRHVVEVRAEGHEPYRREIEVAALERLDVQASLSRIDDSTVWENPWLWVAVGVVLVGAGVGVGVGVASSSTADPYGGTTGVVLQGLTAR